jgi:pimeloyl-ACP methyl ester carboxylesterase
MPFTTVAGERLFYALVEGDPIGKRNLILVHGAGGDHTHWPAELRRLGDVNVYALDLPGHGRSGDQGRTTVDDYASSVHLFVQTLGLGRVSVVGHSMGGAIAQVLALRQPSWLDRIVLVATGARLRVHPRILEGLRRAQAEDPRKSASNADLEATIDTICRRAYGPSTDEQILRNGRRKLLDVDPNVIFGDYIACDNFDVMDQVREIKLPTLIVVGSADQMTPPKYGHFLHEQIPNAQLVEITNGGHMVAVEKPTEVAQAVARFLEIS